MVRAQGGQVTVDGDTVPYYHARRAQQVPICCRAQQCLSAKSHYERAARIVRSIWRSRVGNDSPRMCHLRPRTEEIQQVILNTRLVRRYYQIGT
jgi:hypothetical protein